MNAMSAVSVMPRRPESTISRKPSVNVLPAHVPPAQVVGARDYARIEAAIARMLAGDGPSLAQLAEAAGLSPFHFQRLFKRWAGVSPKQFMSYVTLEHAKAALEQSASVLDTALDVGLSGPSRLHDLFVAVEAMTPGEYKAQGRDLEIRYGFHDTPFGPALLLATDRGVCGFEFIAGAAQAALDEAKARWPLSRFVADATGTAAIVAQMFDGKGETPALLLRGTNWQIQVWSALLRLPAGSITSYSAIAKNVCTIKASRAVGTALAANTIAYLVPCHRVLRATGLFKSYRWGVTRRTVMLGWEAARLASSA
jgi:AraC family transcriptional regulator of adaptative response/methylated-DNA-[protein]-cysteine methyltransferase